MKSKRLWMGLPVLAAIAFFQMPVLAADGTLTVQLYYDDTVKFQKGDYFTITCNQSGGEERTLEIDCADIPDSGMELDVPEGDYQVTDITYSGGNSTIEERGYGITSQFSVTAGDSYNEIRVAVGDEETEKLDMMYDSVMLKQSGVLVSDIAEWNAPDSEESSAEHSGAQGDLETKPTNTDDTHAESATEEEPSKTVAEETETDTGNHLLKAVPLMVLAVVGFGIIFYLHKKGTV